MSIEFVSNKALSFMEWLPPRDSEVESKVARFAIKFFVIAAFTLFVCAVFFRGRASLVMKNDV
ncbi:hypothetical protein K0U07_05385, partial [bacterium]|nr:hypothetical protein [bacterium]